LHALAGIAQPDNFFMMLRECGLQLHETTALPDHYDFDSYSPNRNLGYTLICTEKDASKLWIHHPDAWAVPLLQTLPDSFAEALDVALSSINTSPLSSPHGYKTH
jgi:tetraacyldisaccharide 4'-kinase